MFNLLKGQAANPVDSTEKRFHWTPVPVIYATPETGWAFGVGGVVTYRFDESKRPSQSTFGAVYTTLDQLLLYMNFRIFWNGDTYLSYGEIGYYKYVYNFYGVGVSATLDNEELYKVNFPRVRANLLVETTSDWYFGGRLAYEDYQIQDLEGGGEVSGAGVSGGRGGVTSGLGLVTNHDSRNDQLFPTKGWFFEGLILPHANFLASDFNFLKTSADLAYYHPLKAKMLLAFNLYAESNIGGEIPFQQLAMLGGPNKMRGYYEGRYRDRNAVILQAEYRWMFYKRFGFAAFANTAKIGGQNQAVLSDQTQLTGGAGLRFQLAKSSSLNLRLDVAYTDDGNANFYLTFGEAF